MYSAGGAVAGIAGFLLVLMLVDGNSECDTSTWDPEDPSQDEKACQVSRRTTYGLGGATAAGLGLAITALVLPEDPASQEDRVRLATDYNKRLRKRLGVSESDLNRPSKKRTTPPRDARLSISAGRGSGFVSLAVTF